MSEKKSTPYYCALLCNDINYIFCLFGEMIKLENSAVTRLRLVDRLEY